MLQIHHYHECYSYLWCQPCLLSPPPPTQWSVKNVMGCSLEIIVKKLAPDLDAPACHIQTLNLLNLKLSSIGIHCLKSCHLSEASRRPRRWHISLWKLKLKLKSPATEYIYIYIFHCELVQHFVSLFYLNAVMEHFTNIKAIEGYKTTFYLYFHRLPPTRSLSTWENCHTGRVSANEWERL